MPSGARLRRRCALSYTARGSVSPTSLSAPTGGVSPKEVARAWYAFGTLQGAAHPSCSAGTAVDPAGGIISVSPDSVRRWSRAGIPHQVVRLRHVEPDSAAAISPDGRFVVIGGPTGGVAVLDFVGDAPRVLGQHRGGPITTVASGPDGRTIASAGEGDGLVRIWDSSTGPPVVPPGSALSSSTAPVFASDGTLVAVADYSTVKVWHTAGGRPRLLKGGPGEVLDLAFAPGNRAVLTVSDDGFVRLRTLSGVGVRTLRRLGAPVAAAFSPDRLHAATADDRGSLAIWSIEGGPPVILSRRARGISGIRFSPDGRRIATADGTRTIRIWGTGGGVPQTVRAPGAVYGVAFDPSGTALALPSNRDVYLWPLDRSGRRPVLLGRHERFANAVAFSPSGDDIASGGTPGEVRIWNLAGGDPLVLSDGRFSVDAVAYGPNGTSLATVGNDSKLHVWSCLACGPVDHLLDIAHRVLPREIAGSTPAK